VAIDYFLTFAGREVIDLSADEMARWVEATKVVKDTYMTEKAAMGLPVADYEEYLNERADYWAGKAPPAEECVAWVEAEVEPFAPAK